MGICRKLPSLPIQEIILERISELEPLKVILYNAIFYDGLKKIHHKDDLQDINLVLLKYDFNSF